MSRLLARIVIAAAALVMLVPVTAVAQNTLLNNKYENTSTEYVCNDADGNRVGTVTYNGPESMWPPNHKYVPISIVGQADDPEDTVRLITAGSHDEYDEETGEELNGAGNTTDDVSPAMDSDEAVGTATTNHSLRSERSGRGDGRTYTLDWDVIFTDSDGDGTYGTAYCGSADIDGDGQPPVDAQQDAFRVEVPHDQRCGAGWKHDKECPAASNGDDEGEAEAESSNGNGNGNGRAALLFF